MIVNLEILKNPVNWFVVWTMLAIGFLLLRVVARSMTAAN